MRQLSANSRLTRLPVVLLTVNGAALAILTALYPTLLPCANVTIGGSAGFSACNSALPALQFSDLPIS